MAVIQSNSGAYTIIGAPSLIAYILGVNPGSYAITGTAALFTHGFGITAVSGSYVLTGSIVSIERIAAEPGAYLLQGKDATLRLGPNKVIAVSGSYIITGGIAILEHAIPTDRGTLAVTGIAATLTRSGTGNTLSANTGSYNITGTAAGLVTFIPIDSGDYQLTGTAVTFRLGNNLVSAKGIYTVGGQAAILHRAIQFSALAGVYNITASVITGLRHSGSAAKFIIPETGFYNLTGSAAIALPGRFISATNGSYTLTGTIAVFDSTFALAAGIYTLTGQSVTLLTANKVLNAISGIYALTGTVISAEKVTLFTLDSGSYLIQPSNTTIQVGRGLVGSFGAYTLTGASVLFRATQIVLEGGVYLITPTPTNEHNIATTRPKRWRKQPKRTVDFTNQPVTETQWEQQPESPGV